MKRFGVYVRDANRIEDTIDQLGGGIEPDLSEPGVCVFRDVPENLVPNGIREDNEQFLVIEVRAARYFSGGLTC